jgi:hypothetical protein
MLWTYGVAGAGLFLVLLRAARLRIVAAMPEAVAEPAAAGAPRLSPRTVAVLAATGALGLAAVAAVQVRDARAVPRPIAGLERPLELAAAWQAVPEVPSPLEAAFTRPTRSLARPLLLLDIRRPAAGGPTELLAELEAETAPNLADYERFRGPLSWDRHCPGAVALDFFYSLPQPAGEPMIMVGCMAAVPLGGSDVLALGLLADLNEFEARRWELIRIAEWVATAGD